MIQIKKQTEDRFSKYPGFDYINELDKHEAITKCLINIICYNEDKLIKNIRKSTFNSEKEPKYLNLYANHLCVSIDLFKLAKSMR